MIVDSFSYTQKEIEENHRIFLQRNEFFKKNGLNRLETSREIAHYLPDSCNSILEIGTGKGHLSIELAKKTNKFISVDIDEHNLRIAYLNLVNKHLENNVELIIKDAKSLNYKNLSFDIVISAFSYHHFILPFAVLKEMIRLTQQKIILADFNKQGMSIINKIHQLEGREHQVKSDDFNLIGQYLKMHGFEVQKHEKKHQTIFIGQRI